MPFNKRSSSSPRRR